MILYYILVNLLYFCSFLFFGEKISRMFSIDKSLEKISIKYLQYPILSISFFTYISSILIQIGIKISFIAIAFNTLLLSTGIFYLLKKKNDIKFINPLKIKNESALIIIILSYLLLSFSPITDADSLAYHAYFPKKILYFNQFNFDFYNFHESLIGLLEFFYTIPLFIKSDYTLHLINFFSFLSIVSIFYKTYSGKENYIKIFCLLIFTSPIFLHLVYSAKPQLLFISLSLLSFCLIYNENIIKNFKFIILLIFIIIFNFSGKSNFLISSLVLSVFLFSKIYKNLTLSIILKIIFVSLILYMPIVYGKYLNLDKFNLNNLINFIPSHLPGYKEFWIYLTNAQKENFFPISLFFPTNLTNISQSLGLWPILILFILKIKKEIIFPVTLFFLMIAFGLKSNRFYLEPFLWISYILITNIILKDKYRKFIENFSLIQIIPMFGIIIYTSLYFFSANLNQNQKQEILANSAYGYNFNKIINEKIGNEEFVLYNSRSLYYGNLNLIYMEFEKFSKDNFYYEIIANLNPKYLVLIDNEKKNEFLNNCKLDLIYKSKIKSKINRKNVFFGKNFEKNRISSIKIYEFNNKNAKFCINR